MKKETGLRLAEVNRRKRKVQLPVVNRKMTGAPGQRLAGVSHSWKWGQKRAGLK